MNNGWIKLHRKFTKWEWYTDVPVKVVFLHLLLEANHEGKKWQGREIQRGQCVIGRKVLADETGLSEQQIRTALDKLKKTGEITTESTNRFTIATIVNYSLYQTCDEEEQPTNNQQATSKQPTDNQQATTNKNVKNIKNEKKERNICDADEVIDHLNSRTGSSYRHSDSARKHILGRLNEGFTVQDCKDVIDKKCVDWMGTDYEKFLVPDTLFRPSNFEKYLNQRIAPKKGQNVF